MVEALGLYSIDSLPCNFSYILFGILYLLNRRLSLDAVVVADNTCDLDDTHHAKEEVHCCKTVAELVLAVFCMAIGRAE